MKTDIEKRDFFKDPFSELELKKNHKNDWEKTIRTFEKTR